MIELRTLGGTSLRAPTGAELVPLLAQPKRLGLLAYLALAGRPGFCRRDTLVALFWPELDAEHARGALRQALRFLRRELGAGAVVTRGDEDVGVDPGRLWCDAVAFEEACTSDPAMAAELYRGDLLVGFHVDDAAPEFDRWLEDRRAQLRQRSIVCLWTLARARRDSGARVEASALARRVASLAPDDESQLTSVLVFLDELGDRAGALSTYESFARRLRDEHGAKPSPETRVLLGRIRVRTAAGHIEPLRIAGVALPAPNVPLTAAGTAAGTAVGTAGALADPMIAPPRAPNAHRTGKVLLASAVATALITGGAFVRRETAPRWTAPTVMQSLRGAPDRATHARAPRFGTLDPVARDLYVRGRYYWTKRGPGLTTSIGYFTKALDADPTFALAYSGLGDAYVQLGYGSVLRPDDAFPKARAAAHRALELDSTLAEPHATLGFVKLYFEWNWPDAEREFRRALALDPNYATGHEWYGLHLAAMGRFDEAIAEVRRAQELDPLSTSAAATSAWVQYYAGRYDAAERELEVVLRDAPTFALAHFYLGRVHEARGDLSRALAEYEASGPLRPWAPTVAAWGRVLAVEGRPGEARASLATMDSMARRTYVTAYAMALVHAALAQPDSAFAWLDRGVEERTHWLVWLNRDPRWHSIRGDARFAALVTRMGLPP